KLPEAGREGRRQMVEGIPPHFQAGQCWVDRGVGRGRIPAWAPKARQPLPRAGSESRTSEQRFAGGAQRQEVHRAAGDLSAQTRLRTLNAAPAKAAARSLAFCTWPC